ncbi:imelysin family protein [Marinicellulosiphila megalodicopiae]|uniref:imelysin family protein n=1 Tax=Marinicellulosiphila megalodicopiae TaxID=2724896 RepID=UPI003BB16793
MRVLSTIFLISILLFKHSIALSADFNPALTTFENKVTSHITSMQQQIHSMHDLSCELQMKEIKDHWFKAYQQYLAISYMDLEVINVNLLNYSFAFWPDKKNLIAKKMNQLIQLPELTADVIEQSSSPVKGFQAIEFLLFDASQNSLNCNALKAITENLIRNSEKIQSQLIQYPIIKPQYFIGDKQIEGLSIAFNEIINHLSSIIKKLETITNDKINQKILFSEAWRSQKAFSFHTQNTLYSLEYTSIFFDLFKPENKLALQNITLTLKNQLNALPNTYATIYNTKQSALLFEHQATLKQYHSILTSALLSDFNITLGFNNSDGD